MSRYLSEHVQQYPPPAKRAREDPPPAQITLGSSSSDTRSAHDRSVRWKVDTESRYFRRYSAPEMFQQEKDEEAEEEEEEEGEEEGGGEREEGEGRVYHPKVISLHAPTGEWIAAAYYDPQEKVLHVLEDTKDTVAWDLAILLLEQWEPDMVIMSSQAQDSMIDKVQEWCKERNKVFELQPHKTYTPSLAIQRLSEVQLPEAGSAISEQDRDEHYGRGYEKRGGIHDSEDPGESVEEVEEEVEEVDRFAKYRENGDDHAGMGRVRLSMVKLGCWVNVDAPKAVSAAGGLLTFLAMRNSEESFREVQVPIERIESMQLEKYLLINQDALQSLAVFDYQSGAASHNVKEKEALSIYTLLRTTVTPLGHKLLYTWHLRPLADLEMIKARHDAVEVFSSGMNQESTEAMTKAMKRIKNIPIHTKRLRRGRGGIREWRALIDALVAANEIRERLVGTPSAKRLSVTRNVAGMTSPEVRDLQNAILKTIDFDESTDVDRVCVRPGVDEELDQLREEFEELKIILAAVAMKVKETVDPRRPVELEVQYFPSLGFLVNITPGEDGFHPPHGWTSMFSANNGVYWKTPETMRLDEEYGDIDTTIQAKELVIVQALNEKMKTVDKEISKIMDIIAELDCLLALARAAIAYRLVRPVMVEEPVLEIRKGRHLLQENYVQTYIANDTMISGGPAGKNHNMMIVTGANGSGKSAYGKQVALIVIMAQIGGFVPAEEAVIGVVDKIYTRMQTRESVSKASSAFMIDLAQVSLALRGVTSRSLVILDEFGKGTLPADGAGLLAGVIEYLINGCCPRTLVLTHFHELFTQQFIDDSLPILHCHMKTILTEGTKDIEYLYQLQPGKRLTSNAAECALAHGIPRHVVERGREVSELVSRFEIARLHDKPLTDKEQKELREAERLAKAFLEWEIDPETQDVKLILKDILANTLGQDEDEEGASIVSDDQSIEPQAVQAEQWDESSGLDRTQNVIEVMDDSEDNGRYIKQEVPDWSPQNSSSSDPAIVDYKEEDHQEYQTRNKGYTDQGRWKGKGRAVAVM